MIVYDNIKGEAGPGTNGIRVVIKNGVNLKSQKVGNIDVVIPIKRTTPPPNLGYVIEKFNVYTSRVRFYISNGYYYDQILEVDSDDPILQVIRGTYRKEGFLEED